MITEYTIRDINRNDTLHKEKLVLASQVQELLEQFISAAVKAGASEDKLMGIINDGK